MDSIAISAVDSTLKTKFVKIGSDIFTRCIRPRVSGLIRNGVANLSIGSLAQDAVIPSSTESAKLTANGLTSVLGQVTSVANAVSTVFSCITKCVQIIGCIYFSYIVINVFKKSSEKINSSKSVKSVSVNDQNPVRVWKEDLPKLGDSFDPRVSTTSPNIPFDSGTEIMVKEEDTNKFADKIKTAFNKLKSISENFVCVQEELNERSEWMNYISEAMNKVSGSIYLNKLEPLESNLLKYCDGMWSSLNARLDKLEKNGGNESDISTLKKDIEAVENVYSEIWNCFYGLENLSKTKNKVIISPRDSNAKKTNQDSFSSNSSSKLLKVSESDIDNLKKEINDVKNLSLMLYGKNQKDEQKLDSILGNLERIDKNNVSFDSLNLIRSSLLGYIDKISSDLCDACCNENDLQIKARLLDDSNSVFNQKAKIVSAFSKLTSRSYNLNTNINGFKGVLTDRAESSGIKPRKPTVHSNPLNESENAGATSSTNVPKKYQQLRDIFANLAATNDDNSKQAGETL